MTGDIPDVSGGLCRAIEALQDRQVLLRYTFDELATARRTAVVRCFIDALTRGGNCNSYEGVRCFWDTESLSDGNFILNK